MKIMENFADLFRQHQNKSQASPIFNIKKALKIVRVVKSQLLSTIQVRLKEEQVQWKFLLKWVFSYQLLHEWHPKT